MSLHAIFGGKEPTSSSILSQTNNNQRNDDDHLSSSSVPRHVAFICDGNSRWAKARNLPSSAGHAAGADQLVKILDALKESGVRYCSLFAFSTENWNRPTKEIDDLMRIMEESCHRFYNRALQENVRVQVLGDLNDDRIPSSLKDALCKLQNDTTTAAAAAAAGNNNDDDSPFTVCFAINYGGKKDILDASLKLAQAIANDEISPDDVDEQLFASLLSTQQIPDPDLIIRTSGECRLSNFMLWNAAYAELYFTDVMWPDFDKKSWQQALTWYSQRQRKFGGRQAKQQRQATADVSGL